MSHTPIHCCLIEECCKPLSEEHIAAVAAGLREAGGHAHHADHEPTLEEMLPGFLRKYRIIVRKKTGKHAVS
jgi:hypothetical protein